MGTPPALRELPTAADREDPTAVLCGKELRMGPGRVTTTGEASMNTVESAQRATQGSLQLLASGVGPEVPQGRGGHGLKQDISGGAWQS